MWQDVKQLCCVGLMSHHLVKRKPPGAVWQWLSFAFQAVAHDDMHLPNKTRATKRCYCWQCCCLVTTKSTSPLEALITFLVWTQHKESGAVEQGKDLVLTTVYEQLLGWPKMRISFILSCHPRQDGNCYPGLNDQVIKSFSVRPILAMFSSTSHTH